MTAEARWRQAFEAEAQEPSNWTPDVVALAERVRARLIADGCEWVDLALTVIAARATFQVDRRVFGQRLGLDELSTRALEGGGVAQAGSADVSHG